MTVVIAATALVATIRAIRAIRVRRLALVTTVLAVIIALGLFDGTRISRGHTLHNVAVAVVARNLDGGVGQLVLQILRRSEDDHAGYG